jgi:hypothetical protein
MYSKTERTNGDEDENEDGLKLGTTEMRKK